MGLGGLHIWHLLILLVVVILVFGTKKLKNIGQDLGDAVKGFRSAMAAGEKGEGTSEPAQISDSVRRPVDAPPTNAPRAEAPKAKASATPGTADRRADWPNS